MKKNAIKKRKNNFKIRAKLKPKFALEHYFRVLLAGPGHILIY